MSSWWSALNPFVEVRAEEAHEEEHEKDSNESEGGEEEEKEDEGEGEGGDDDEEEEEEEEEEEPEDPKPKLVEHAMNHSCPTEKHHFDACAARVAKAAENPEEGGHHGGHPEDCAEEFLHLMHCVDKTIAETLFRQLK